ncbi:MAG: SDR family oxidoreductase [Victivallales bacterium]|nr:SDR family oxidoreductase [Victivallales bacterium]
MIRKVLITGITGLVGSAFACEALRRDKKLHFVAIVRGKDNISARNRVADGLESQCTFDCTPELAKPFMDRIDVIEGDIADPVHLAMSPQLQGIESIFHCAADVNLGMDGNGHTFNVNYNGTKALLKIASELKLESFHYVSTAYVAGRSAGRIKEEESAATEWNNPYERSKFESERMVRNSGVPFSIYRPSIIVGRRSDGKIRKPLAFYFILEFLGVIKERQCAKRHLDPKEVIDIPLRMQAYPSETVFFVPVDYITETVTSLFFRPCENKTYHLTGKHPVSTKAIEKAVAKALKVKNVRIVENCEDPTMDEKLLQRFLGEFIPYFGSRAFFDVSNVEKVFGKESLEWNFNGDKLTALIASYYKDHFPELMDTRFS